MDWSEGSYMAVIYDEMNEKTKERIQQSILHLLKDKPFVKISVQDITSGVGINRGTFYLHYQDKYDLIEQMEATLLKGLEMHLNRLIPEKLLKKAERGEVSMLAVEVFHYIQINAPLFQALLGENNHFGFHKRLKQFFTEHFGKKMMINEDFFSKFSLPKEYLSAFAISAFLGLIEEWLEKGLSETPDEMAEMYIQIIFFIKEI